MPMTVTDSDAFTDPIQTIADGEVLDAAHLSVDSQGLSNRTRYFKNRLGAFFEVASGDVQGTPSQAITSNVTPTDVTGSSISLPGAKNGDVVEVDAIAVFRGDGASQAQVSIAIVDGVTTDNDFASNVVGMAEVDTGNSTAVPLKKTRTIAGAGAGTETVTVKLQGLRFAGGTTIYVDRFLVRARLKRAT